MLAFSHATIQRQQAIFPFNSSSVQLTQTIQALEHTLSYYHLAIEDDQSACWELRRQLAEAYFSLGLLYENDAKQASDLVAQEEMNLKAVAYFYKAADLTSLKKAETKLISSEKKAIDKSSFPNTDSELEAETLFFKGMLFFSGLAGHKNYHFAFAYFQQAAALHYPPAQCSLGCMHFEGLGTPLNRVSATAWYRIAAENGEVQAQYHLATLYEAGEELEHSDPQAIFWYEQAAKQGHAPAQLALGQAYECGKLVPRDFVKAFFWIRKAALQGYADAQYQLGAMYERGLRPSPQKVKDPTAEAISWYRKAFKQKHRNSATKLACLYVTNLFPADLAAKYCRQDYKEGMSEAHHMLNKIALRHPNNISVRYHTAMIDLTDKDLRNTESLSFSTLSLTRRPLFNLIYNSPNLFYNEVVNDEVLTHAQRVILLTELYIRLPKDHLLNPENYAGLSYILGTAQYDSLASEELVNNPKKQKQVAYQAFNHLSRVNENDSRYEEAAAYRINILSRYHPEEAENAYYNWFTAKKKTHPLFADIPARLFTPNRLAVVKDPEEEADCMRREAVRLIGNNRQFPTSGPPSAKESATELRLLKRS